APDALARAVLTADERATVDDVDGVIARAVSATTAFRANPEVAALLGAGTLLREVPFSMVMDDAPVRTIVRGAIDLLVVPADGPIVVVEFKTGRSRPSHERQLALYVKAARALYAGRAVEGRLIYP
ncbi:MAG TPA: PD-(D/E)XK nuclease family protein, partial [Gemmatimonadaceae bacterium]|nr:PD-(D/E)XK nuclease family protein [Gemmatimonadaceae bacterium]